ncbi:MAG TPA: hypothetical protein VL294_03635 [Pseudolysinimonas sp.]|jgi:hypothetical protein|nr:hypothetical protein [Pseudolysinimonas sp.]
MTVQCPAGHENQDGSQFCNTCGAAIAAPPAGTGPSSTAAASTSPNWPRLAAIAGGAVVVIAIAVVLGISVTTAASNAERQAAEEAASEAEAEAAAARLQLLPDAIKGCGLDSSVVQDDGRSAFLDNKGNDFGSGDLTVDDLVCVLNAIDTPDAVINHMANTRSLDGTQSDSWGDFAATWTYHPDNGLDIIIKLVD